MSDDDINKGIVSERFYALKGNKFSVLEISHYPADVTVPPISGFPPTPITIPAITIDTNDKYFLMKLSDFEKKASEYDESIDINSEN